MIFILCYYIFLEYAASYLFSVDFISFFAGSILFIIFHHITTSLHAEINDLVNSEESASWCRYERLISLAKFNGYIQKKRAAGNAIQNSKTHQFYYAITMIADIGFHPYLEQSKLLEQLLFALSTYVIQWKKVESNSNFDLFLYCAT